ncbi:MAG: hypothetical protein GKS06_04610 [Acidobacteria bacterium]|nr:hypothetical protein [Acidobacteriota bacterium]
MRADRSLCLVTIGLVLSAGVGSARATDSSCESANVLCVAADGSAEYADIQHAVDAARPGSTVWVQAGDYAGFRVRRGGSPEHQLRIVAAADVRIIGSEPYSQEAIYLENVSWVTIEGFVVDAAGLPGFALGAHDARPERPMRGLRIRNNVVRGAGSTNIYLSQVADSLIEGNVAAGSRTSHGIYLANAGSDDTVLRGNNSYDNAKNGIHFNGDLASTGDGLQTGLVIEANVVHGNAANGLNLDGVQASRIHNNLVFGNRRHALRAYAIDGAAGPHRVVVVNNTFVDNGSWAIKFTDDDGDHVFFNNILISGAGSIAVGNVSLHSDYNLAPGPFSFDGEASTTSLAGWRSAGLGVHGTHQEASDVFVDRALGDFRLAPDAGRSLRGVATLSGEVPPAKDLLGRDRVMDPVLGAFSVPSDARRGR